MKLLKAIRTLKMEDSFIGRFSKYSWLQNGIIHTEPGYLDDETVPEGSTCPTYAAVALMIDNDRWSGVPFLMRAGKGLDERLGEVRVTFKKKGFNKLVPGGSNELVMRIQPEEAVYLKVQNKMPGLAPGPCRACGSRFELQECFPRDLCSSCLRAHVLEDIQGRWFSLRRQRGLGGGSAHLHSSAARIEQCTRSCVM